MAASDRLRLWLHQAINNQAVADELFDLLDVIDVFSGTGDTLTLTLPAGGNLVITNLPTSDPSVAGALWIDSGTLMISSG